MNPGCSLPNSKAGIFSCTPCLTLFSGLILAALLIGCAPSETHSENTSEGLDPAFTSEQRESIRSVLMRQEDAWNAGDIDAFMSDYIQSDTLRFTSGGSVRYGWDTTLQRYYDTYPDRDAMGSLTFDDLEIDVLSSEWALVFGSWHLKRGGDYEDIGGRYTLLLRSTPEGWKILYDHTSQAD